MILLLLICSLLCFPVSAWPQGVVINAVGDIMLGGRGSSSFARLGYDYPFAATLAELKNSGITIGNLEAPITQNGTEFTGKRFRFKSDPQAAAALKRAGFSVLTLANNHMLDYGKTGLQETRRHLARNGILSTGAGENLTAARTEAVISTGGKKVAFLAYSLTRPEEFYAGKNRAGTAPGYPPHFGSDIARVRAGADYVIVSFHWGREMATAPRPYQMAVAHRAIEAGADLVLGHHPHVLQGIERYKNGLILYSLGNFAFASVSPGAARSVIARVTLDEGIKEVELIPLNVQNSVVRFQPRVATGQDGQRVMDHLNRISRDLGTLIVNDAGRYLVLMEPDRRRLAGK